MNINDLIEAASNGSSEASLILGFLYEHGLGVEKDRREAAQWYERAAQAGLPLAQHNYASICSDLGLPNANALAFHWYSMAAKKNFAPSQNALGLIYELGIGVEANMPLAIDWYSHAAQNGSKVAAFHLALVYEQGIGVSKDDLKAGEWYMRAAELGDSAATYIVACRYRDGVSGTANLALALEWFEKAAALGSAEGHSYLAVIYSQGLLGVQVDSEKARQHSKQAGECLAQEKISNQDRRKSVFETIQPGRAGT